MQNLARAHQELYRRTPDERFSSFAALVEHCRQERQSSQDRWQLPSELRPSTSQSPDSLLMEIGSDGAYLMNSWSFGQVCKLAGVNRQTVNRLSPDTAKRVFYETLPTGDKPLQVLTSEKRVRSVHAASYTRLWNADLLDVIQEYATDFQPPQKAGAGNGGTGLYCGEQDMFAFLIDPTGWAEIGGEAFAPGFFVWNSEVGRRSVGIETFWFQAICANHIVWDAVEVVEFTRKHTTNVREALNEIRRIFEALVASRDSRRDAFVNVVRRAMETRLGDVADDVALTLAENGITKSLAAKAIEFAEKQGGFTIFALVDALTRLAGEAENAGDRLESDQKAASLLALAV